MTDGQREGVLLHLRELVGHGVIDLDRYEILSSVVIGAASVADLVDVMARVPPAVPLTPESRRLTEPLELRTFTGSLVMDGRWQVGQVTNVSVATGSITLDLTNAELDDHVVDMTVKVASGSAKLVIPFGLDVQLVGVTGTVKNRLGPSLAPPGSPVLRLDLLAATGTIKLLRPKVAGGRRWWRRRRRR